MRESVIYQEIIQRGEQQGLQLGVKQGVEQEAKSLVMRLLNRRFLEIDTQLQARICALSVVELENLGEALFDFSDVADLVAWLDSDRAQN